MEFIILIIKLIAALIVVFAIMYLLAKLSNDQIDRINYSRYIKILEKTSISKDSSIILLKIGKKGYVISSSNKGLEKLEEISEEDIEEIETEKKNQKENIKNQYKNLSKSFNFFSEKLKYLKKKEEKYEEK